MLPSSQNPSITSSNKTLIPRRLLRQRLLRKPPSRQLLCHPSHKPSFLRRGPNAPSVSSATVSGGLSAVACGGVGTDWVHTSGPITGRSRATITDDPNVIRTVFVEIGAAHEPVAITRLVKSVRINSILYRGYQPCSCPLARVTPRALPAFRLAGGRAPSTAARPASRCRCGFRRPRS